MTLAKIIGAALLVLGSAVLPARAEVLAASPASFSLQFKRPIEASAAKAFEAVAQLPAWWNGDHSWSGKASNLSLGMQAGGCFCERWEGNSIEHARVVFHMQDKLLRLNGAFGPLQKMGVTGILDIEVLSTEGKRSLQLSYRVLGTPESGLDKLAAIVDKVLGEQFDRLGSFIETGKPTKAS